MIPAIKTLQEMKDSGLTSVNYNKTDVLQSRQIANFSECIRFFGRMPAVLAMLVCAFFLSVGHLHATPQNSIANSIDRPQLSREIEDPYVALEESYRQALETEREKLDYLAERVSRAEARASEIDETYASHQVMISNHANLLAVADVDLQVLSRAHARQQVELAHIRERIAAFSASISEFETLEN